LSDPSYYPGVYYPEKHGDAFKKMNKNIELIYKKHADHVVFQSEYSRKQCFHVFGEKEHDKFSVITNGVDKDIFFPNRDLNEAPDKLRFITTGNFRDRSMLEPLIQALDRLGGEFSFELNVVGPLENEGLNVFLERDYVIYHGEKDLSGVSEMLRNCHVFLYSHINPPCPNSVIEAVSCGLPVVGFNSGALGELCGFSADLLAGVKAGLLHSYGDLDPENLKDKISLSAREFGKFRKTALDNSGAYSMEECGRKYLELLNALEVSISRE